MYILIKVVYCRSYPCPETYPFTETAYRLSNKSFICKNCRDLIKAWRWICRKQQKSDFYISFSAYFCSENGVSSISSYSMSREIANIDDDGFCREIYSSACEIATCEYLFELFCNQFDDYSKIFD